MSCMTHCMGGCTYPMCEPEYWTKKEPIIVPTTDELITKYAKMLQDVYTNRSAGDYTFSGILNTMLREMEQDKPPVKIQNPLPYHPPGARSFDDDKAL